MNSKSKYVAIVQGLPCQKDEGNIFSHLKGMMMTRKEVQRVLGNKAVPGECSRVETANGKCLFCEIEILCEDPIPADFESGTIVRIMKSQDITDDKEA